MKLARSTIIKTSLFGLALLAAFIPLPASWAERYYANGLYPSVQAGLTPVSNIAPFACTDALLLTLILCLPAWWVFALKRTERGRRWRQAGKLAINTLAMAAIAYLLFLSLWGFNYQRQPLTTKLDYDAQRVTDDALKEFRRLAVERVNLAYQAARTTDWPDEPTWRNQLHQSFGATLAHFGHRRNITLAIPKTTIFDFYLGATSIAGFINPFAQEVVLDKEALFFEKPYLLAHEWAHLAGYANEAEASFIGALALIGSDHPALQYSGWLLLIQHSPWPVANNSAEGEANERTEPPPKPAPEVLDDLRAIDERLQRRQSALLNRLQWAMYDRFLKANRVQEGTRSYGLLVNLIVGTRIEMLPAS